MSFYSVTMKIESDPNRVEWLVNSTDSTRNASSSTARPSSSRYDRSPTVLFSAADTAGSDAVSGNLPKYSPVRWVVRELEGRVTLVVGTEYSPEPKVLSLMIGICQGDDKLEFRVEYPNQGEELERLHCRALGIVGCVSLLLLRDLVRGWNFREDSGFALNRFKARFKAFGNDIRSSHSWVSDAHLDEVGLEFWFWLCHSPQKLDNFNPWLLEHQPVAF